MSNNALDVMIYYLFLPHLSSILDFNFIQKSGSLQKYKNKNKNKKILLSI